MNVHCVHSNEYSGLPLPDNVAFDTELVSITISKLKRGKAPGIDGLMAEHLMFSHPILAVILSKLFNLMLSVRCVPRGFKSELKLSQFLNLKIIAPSL